MAQLHTIEATPCKTDFTNVLPVIGNPPKREISLPKNFELDLALVVRPAGLAQNDPIEAAELKTDFRFGFSEVENPQKGWTRASEKF